MITYNEEDFKAFTGQAPQDDDLERLNCPKAGEPGHANCGFCKEHQKPRFVCGCRHKKSKLWMGRTPKKCQFCEFPLLEYFVDGRTIYGYWGFMCLPCHSIFGVGLGIGKGQKYNLTTLEKVEG